jgi:hypothetical protein
VVKNALSYNLNKTVVIIGRTLRSNTALGKYAEGPDTLARNRHAGCKPRHPSGTSDEPPQRRKAADQRRVSQGATLDFIHQFTFNCWNIGIP